MAWFRRQHRLTSSRRTRHILIASVISLLISATLLGLIAFTRWRGHQALATDTRAVIGHTREQLVRTLTSRRGTLTFIRDTLNRRADLTSPQLQAMGASGIEHTRHLISVGLIRASQAPEWWAGPQTLSRHDTATLNQAIGQRVQLRGAWRVPSTFVTTVGSQRTLLVMLEPLRAAPYRQSAIIGVFDMTPLLEDFVVARVSQPYPVQLWDGETLLYRSPNWQPETTDRTLIVMEERIALDAARWTLQMQPGSTRVVQTLSSVNVLLVGLSAVAGAGVIVIVWILAARTWILQRAVRQRTAALRRTMERLRQMAITDELTGLYNRRFFTQRWEWEYSRAKRYQRPLACLMIDVNEFKQVNDRLGHHVGDLVLKQVAGELKSLLRQSDILARFGGDEFVIALPETSEVQALLVADKLRQLHISVPGGKGRMSPVSLSVGMSRLDQTAQSPEQLLQAADASLYTWKRGVSPASAVR